MGTSEKIAFFMLLKAFDRLGNVLQSMDITLPKAVVLLTDDLWGYLASETQHININPALKAIEASVVDEQDANSEEILKNLYLYAFSDFLMFFSEGKESLEAAESSIIDVYDYIAAQQFLLNEKEGKAVILSDDDEEKIKNDPRYVGELAALKTDRAFAENIVQWDDAVAFR
ncbi:hypothetical protein [Pectobacterium versatile]|uniref:hypothetical protein n=1 Tax=Pectobacterium versatile TaxID=2488639 RepID=UPI00102EF2AF|nr:hypothetical protein [Pectobacterium versatile]MBN3194276.1 hypothetical protein [Pectobacterium versatile]TAI96551.1 hypothetical protein EG335_12460 [Pectobacterium versatile]